MFSLFAGRTSHDAVILLHVGSASISAGLGELSAEKPVLVYTSKEPLPYRETLDFDHLVKATEVRIESLLQRVVHEGVPRYTKYKGHAPVIHSILVVLASPWYVSRTSVLSFHKEKPISITEDLVADMIKTARDAFEKEVESGALAQIGEDAVVLEESLIQVELNGYRTHSPFGKKAKDISVAVLFSLFSKKLKIKFVQAMERVVHRVNLSWHTFALVDFSLVRDLYPEEHTFLLMDIDGEVTDVSIVKNGVLLESVSFPCGKYSVLRCLGEEAGPAESRVSVLTRNDAGDSRVTKAREEWLRQYTGALEELREHNAIPHKLFLSGNEDVLPWFEEVLMSYEGSGGVFTKPQSIVALKESFLGPFVSLREGAGYDMSLVSLLLFANKRKSSLR
jgi:hypothetical protein